MAQCVRNELGRCLILICSRRDLPIAVLQNALGLFSFLRQLLGPAVKILVECFMRYIFIKALLQVRVLFSQHDEAMRLISDPQAGSSSAAASVGGSAGMATQGGSGTLNGGHTNSTNSSAPFSVEELEVVLESLVDLLADPSFLPSLFASFDCDPTKSDVVQPLIRYLGTCKRYTLVAEPHELTVGGILEIGALVEQCYGQLVVNFNNIGDEHATGGSSSSDCVDRTDVANYLRLTRLAKEVLSEGAVLFGRKPQEGLRFLQAKGVLANPLSPSTVATFLRIAPGLPKESTGAFLGELGKDNPSFDADGKGFHREVLLSYVQSFELTGQTVLNCLRIFLSAFRLPGEAQQIDRILVAFSEVCHAACVEGQTGILENPEITYLLTFSMIMLNTDLHNPNIRADRRMTSEQFVRNNTFYGKELNQTKPLPREFLEEIYESLANVQIRTERNDLGASITPETWMDLQLQSSIDHEKGIMISTGYSPQTVEMLRRHPRASTSTAVEGAPGNRFSATDVSSVARDLLVASSGSTSNTDSVGALDLTAALYGAHGLVDEDLISCVFQDLVGVSSPPFLCLVSIFPRRNAWFSTPRRAGGVDPLLGSSLHCRAHDGDCEACPGPHSRQLHLRVEGKGQQQAAGRCRQLLAPTSRHTACVAEGRRALAGRPLPPACPPPESRR